MQIAPNEIQIWTADLDISKAQEEMDLDLLSPDENERAHRFRSPIHKKYFVAARSMLRKIIALYTHIAPQNINFSYDTYEKPFLRIPKTSLQFNLSHSDHIAIYAFTNIHAIGVDIEKVQANYNQNVAQRFFTQEENDALLALPIKDRVAGFYQIWARKEAIIKAVGKGLTLPLSSFSVSMQNEREMITFDHDSSWSLLPLSINSTYQSAVASNQIIKKVTYWTLIGQSAQLDKICIYN